MVHNGLPFVPIRWVLIRDPIRPDAPDRTHDLQFRIAFLKATSPTTVESIERYLGSSIFWVIGPAYPAAVYAPSARVSFVAVSGFHTRAYAYLRMSAFPRVLPQVSPSWRRLLHWRGLTPGRIFHSSTVGEAGRPIVCLTGAMPRPRKALAAEAEAAGWEVIDRPHRLTAVLVAIDPDGTSNKLRFASRHGIPIVSLEHWKAVMTDGELPADQTASFRFPKPKNGLLRVISLTKGAALMDGPSLGWKSRAAWNTPGHVSTKAQGKQDGSPVWIATGNCPSRNQ